MNETIPWGTEALGKEGLRWWTLSIQESSSCTRWLSSTTTASRRLKILEEYELRRSTLHLRVKVIHKSGSTRAAASRTPEEQELIELARGNRQR